MSRKIFLMVLLSGVLWVQPAVADIGQEIVKSSERAVSEAISSVLSETIQESEITEEKGKITIWFRPCFNSTEMEINEFDVDVDMDMKQLLGGALFRIGNWYLGATVGYSFLEMAADFEDFHIELDADIASLAPSVTSVFYRGEGLSAWLTLQGSWYLLSFDKIKANGEDEEDDIGDIDIYSVELTGSLLKELTKTVSVLGGLGVMVGFLDFNDADEAWGGRLNSAIKYSKDSLRAQFAATLRASFEDDESLVLEFGPDVNWVFRDKYTIGLGYKYSRLLHMNIIEDLEINSHNIYLNLRIVF